MIVKPLSISESDVDAKVSTKANAGHTHSDIPMQAYNPYMNPNPFMTFGDLDYESIRTHASRHLVQDVVNDGNNSILFEGRYGGGGVLFASGTIPVKSSDKFRGVLELKAQYDGTGASGHRVRWYIGVICYDGDGYRIDPYSFQAYYSKTMTTLATDLINGDTQVNLADASLWTVTGGGSHLDSIRWYPLRPDGTYGFIGNNGRYYDAEKHTRDLLGRAYDGINGNSLDLINPWNKGTILAGTKIQRTRSSGTYQYWNTYLQECTDTFVKVKGAWVSPTDGAFIVNGTSSVKMILLPTWSISKPDGSTETDPLEHAKIKVWLSEAGLERQVTV